jgi:exopolyphosphatase/guanosine-5'-triphosphate,3'-diphosphate pyrophosphatase
VDIGSNTVHSLVCDVNGEGELTPIGDHVEMPELGAEVDRTGRIGSAKRKEALAALKAVVAAAERDGFEALVAGATAAVRRAADGPQLLAAASAQLGVPMRLISEEREAQLSFLGVASRHAGKREWLMADLGGGSLEVVAAEGRRIVQWSSLPIGSGAFAARFLSDPPAASERERLRAAAVAELARAPESEAEKLVATGGSATNLPLVLSRDSPPDVLTTHSLLFAAERLDEGPAADLAAELGITAGRVRAMRAGVEILLLLLDYYGLHSLQVSHQGLRQGMLLAWLESGDRWWVAPAD